jgi:hypothetical protein
MKGASLLGESLKRMPSLKLIEIAPGRHLLTISSGTPIEALEVVSGVNS